MHTCLSQTVLPRAGSLHSLGTACSLGSDLGDELVSKSIVLEAGSLEPEPARGDDGSGRLCFQCAGGRVGKESTREKQRWWAATGHVAGAAEGGPPCALSPPAGPMLPLQGCR